MKLVVSTGRELSVREIGPVEFKLIASLRWSLRRVSDSRNLSFTSSGSRRPSHTTADIRVRQRWRRKRYERTFL